MFNFPSKVDQLLPRLCNHCQSFKCSKSLIVVIIMLMLARSISSYRPLTTQVARSIVQNSPSSLLAVKKRLQQALKPLKSTADEVTATADESIGGFHKLGLCTELLDALKGQQIIVPTPVQQAVIPRIVNGENLVMAASTGSGKTLAFTLPIVQTLHAQEMLGYERLEKRPRCLILVPTRELARQVLDTVKQLGHFSKVSSTAVLGGESYTIQKKSLNRMVDIVVASPGRLMQHKNQGHVYFSHVTHVVIDEVDTMLMQGFGNDIRAILRSVLSRPSASAAAQLLTDAQRSALPSSSGSDGRSAQLLMATATLTKAVRLLLGDVEGGFNIQYSDPTHPTPRKETDTDTRVKLSIVEVDGVHRSLPNVQHVFEETRGTDKVAVLRTVLERHSGRNYRTLIFCNTVSSCRAVEYAMNEDEDIALTYHGDLNSKDRELNLNLFKEGKKQYLVCTDIAARGLDMPETRHVIMFDFPLNPIDYIHRGGRCGRAGRKGLVTSLVAKRDFTLANAIKKSIGKGLPLDSLTADKRDYMNTGKLSSVLRSRKLNASGDSSAKRTSSGKFTGRGRSSDSSNGAGRSGGASTGRSGGRSFVRTGSSASVGRSDRNGSSNTSTGRSTTSTGRSSSAGSYGRSTTSNSIGRSSSAGSYVRSGGSRSDSGGSSSGNRRSSVSSSGRGRRVIGKSR